MPVEIIQGQKFRIPWKVTWDQEIIRVGLDPVYKDSRGFVDWAKAMRAKEFEQIPKFISRTEIRKRYNQICRMDDPNYLYKSRCRNKAYARIRVDKTDGLLALKKKIKRLRKIGVEIKGRTLKEKKIEAEKALEKLLGI